MSEEDQPVDVAALPKFAKTSYESCMSAKDIKSLAIRHEIPLDLHHVARTKGLDIVPSGGMATTWDFLGFCPVFKDTEGNVVTMFEYMRFPLLCGASISNGVALTAQDQIEREKHGSRPKREKRKRGEKMKGKDPAQRLRLGKLLLLINVARPPLSTFHPWNPTDPIRGNPSGAAAKTAESREDRSLHISSHNSANHPVHNYADAHGDKETDNLWLGSFVGQSERALTNVNTEVL
ncbi:hypothetical protein Tco_0454945 [Tanacetum coccineum]